MGTGGYDVPRLTLSRFFIVVTFGLAALAAFSASTGDAGDEGEVRRYVVDFAERWTHSERPEEIAAFYAEDATHINPQGEWVRGREDLTGYFEPLVSERSAGFSADFDVESVLFISERVALVDGSIRIHGMRGASNELFERFTFVMKKNEGGWSISASRVMFPGTR